MAQEELTLDGPIIRTLVLESVIDRSANLGDGVITRQVDSYESLSEMEFFADE